MGGCGKIEIVNHLFFECDSFGAIWYKDTSLIWNFFGSPIGVVPHATQFGGSYLFENDVGLVSDLVWIACCWSI
jgi:hypothetical protein